MKTEKETKSVFQQKLDELQDLKIELESIHRSSAVINAKLINNEITCDQVIAISQLLNQRIKAAKICLSKAYEPSGWFKYQDN